MSVRLSPSTIYSLFFLVAAVPLPQQRTWARRTQLRPADSVCDRVANELPVSYKTKFKAISVSEDNNDRLELCKMYFQLLCLCLCVTPDCIPVGTQRQRPETLPTIASQTEWTVGLCGRYSS